MEVLLNSVAGAWEKEENIFPLHGTQADNQKDTVSHISAVAHMCKTHAELTWRSSSLHDDRIPRAVPQALPNVPFATWIQLEILGFLGNTTRGRKQPPSHD